MIEPAWAWLQRRWDHELGADAQCARVSQVVQRLDALDRRVEARRELAQRIARGHDVVRLDDPRSCSNLAGSIRRGQWRRGNGGAHWAEGDRRAARRGIERGTRDERWLGLAEGEQRW